MHIAEGVLGAPVLATGWGLTAAATFVGLRKLDHERIMTVAMLAAAFFVASLVNVPLGPASAHLVLNGLLGLVLGWACFPALLCGLLLQAIFFQFGGLTVLGVNTFNMAFPALLCGLSLRPLLHKGGKARLIAVLFSGVLTALSLAFTDEGFFTAAKIILLAHLPVMAVEGAVTLFVVAFLAKVQPEILGLAPTLSEPPSDAQQEDAPLAQE